MKFSTIEERTRRKIGAFEYKYCHYTEFDYSFLKKCLFRKKNGAHSTTTYSEIYIMLDTETSKDHITEYDADGKPIPQDNHIVVWTISMRAFHENICTLYGRKPTELM